MKVTASIVSEIMLFVRSKLTFQGSVFSVYRENSSTLKMETSVSYRIWGIPTRAQDLILK